MLHAVETETEKRESFFSCESRVESDIFRMEESKNHLNFDQLCGILSCRSLGFDTISLSDSIRGVTSAKQDKWVTSDV